MLLYLPFPLSFRHGPGWALVQGDTLLDVRGGVLDVLEVAVDGAGTLRSGCLSLPARGRLAVGDQGAGVGVPASAEEGCIMAFTSVFALFMGAPGGRETGHVLLR